MKELGHHTHSKYILNETLENCYFDINVKSGSRKSYQATI